MGRREEDLAAQLAVLREAIEAMVAIDGSGGPTYRGVGERRHTIPDEARTRVETALVSNAGRELVARIRHLEDVARASRRALFHARRTHHRLIKDCEFCDFEFKQLERALAAADLAV